MKFYKVTCPLGWDDIDGGPVFWAGTKRDAQRIKSYIIRENKDGATFNGATMGGIPVIEAVDVPTDKKPLLRFLQSAAQIEGYPTYPSQLVDEATR